LVDDELRQSSFVYMFLKMTNTPVHSAQVIQEASEDATPSLTTTTAATTTSTSKSGGGGGGGGGNTILMSGFLTMQDAGILRITWPSYWFELQATELVYYEASVERIVQTHASKVLSHLTPSRRSAVEAVVYNNQKKVVNKKRKGAFALQDVVNVWPYRHEGLRLIGRQCFKLLVKGKTIPMFAEDALEAERWISELRSALRLPEIIMQPLQESELVGDPEQSVFASRQA
jgi:hypothetical protein